MTPGKRGLVVLALLAVATLCGFASGGTRANAKWERWTYAHVAWEAKAAREVGK